MVDPPCWVVQFKNISVFMVEKITLPANNKFAQIGTCTMTKLPRSQLCPVVSGVWVLGLKLCNLNICRIGLAANVVNFQLHWVNAQLRSSSKLPIYCFQKCIWININQRLHKYNGTILPSIGNMWENVAEFNQLHLWSLMSKLIKFVNNHNTVHNIGKFCLFLYVV